MTARLSSLAPKALDGWRPFRSRTSTAARLVPKGLDRLLPLRSRTSSSAGACARCAARQIPARRLSAIWPPSLAREGLDDSGAPGPPARVRDLSELGSRTGSVEWNGTLALAVFERLGVSPLPEPPMVAVRARRRRSTPTFSEAASPTARRCPRSRSGSSRESRDAAPCRARSGRRRPRRLRRPCSPCPGRRCRRP